jgi:hypothetical protein
MVDRKRIVGVLLQNPLELLRGPVVFHVVEMIEGSVGLGIVGRAVGNTCGWMRLANGREASGKQEAQQDQHSRA